MRKLSFILLATLLFCGCNHEEENWPEGSYEYYAKQICVCQVKAQRSSITKPLKQKQLYSRTYNRLIRTPDKPSYKIKKSHILS